jgi:S-formylglutathione hydrolase
MAASSRPLETISEHRSFGGVQGFYRHASPTIGLPMKFSVFQPPAAVAGPVPVLFYLAGLTCTEETFMIKAGAQRFAAEKGLILVAPDTSPRSTGIEGADRDWDFGHGAGFYVDATEAPWSRHFRMYSYICEELPALLAANFPVRHDRIGLFGHSMGGHGALVLALRNPELFKSVSAFAPILAPSMAPWGEKAFAAYLGPDRQTWRAYDASELMGASRAPFAHGILIDQGLDDQFLAAQLMPEKFVDACRIAGQSLTLRRQAGYDHGYYFIASFIEDHIRFHADILNA